VSGFSTGLIRPERTCRVRVGLTTGVFLLWDLTFSIAFFRVFREVIFSSVGYDLLIFDREDRILDGAKIGEEPTSLTLPWS